MRTTIPEIPSLIKEKTNIIPLNVFEIGASNGMDAAFLQEEFNVDPDNVYCFEPNPNNFNTLSSRYPNFNLFNAAISNFTGRTKFQCHIPAADISSFKKRISHYMYNGDSNNNYFDYEVDVFRMDDFIIQHKIESIDICKIDVEGCSYEVLEGFGKSIKIMKALQIEGELITLYEDQKLFSDFKQILISNNFVMIDYKEFDSSTQCDSVWIRKDYLK